MTPDFKNAPVQPGKNGGLAGARFWIRTFGCQMNVYDADRLRTVLRHLGMNEAEDADVTIFLTCSVREKAEQKILSELGRFREAYDRGEVPLVAVLGCMAQRVGEQLVKRYPWVRVVAGPRHLGMVPQAIEQARGDGRARFLLDDDPHSLYDLETAPLARANAFKAFICVAYGCDRFCTYCIVPHVRGRFQSRKMEEILSEVRALAESGAVEVTLLGQNVDAYGSDLSPAVPFADLLEATSCISGIKRVRFATSHPADFSPQIVDAMARNEKICRAVNLPVQSGSDRILQKMNRGYDTAQYLEIVSLLRKKIPGVAITSDLIVGFPGETQDDFERSVELLERVRFDLVHTAAYSPREGTPAARSDEQLDARVKASRLNAVNALQSRIAREINKTYVGGIYEILIDGTAPKGEGLLQGRTSSDKVVLVRGPREWIGRFAVARNLRASHWCLEGEVLSS